MIELFQARFHGEILPCSGIVQAGKVMKQHSSLPKHALLFVPVHMTKFFFIVSHQMVVLIALRQEFHKQNTMPMILQVEMVCLNFSQSLMMHAPVP